MTKLDLVLARIRNLPPERQDAIATEIAFRLDNEGLGSLLSDEEWAAVEPTLDQDNEEISHAEVASEMRAKFPG